MRYGQGAYTSPGHLVSPGPWEQLIAALTCPTSHVPLQPSDLQWLSEGQRAGCPRKPRACRCENSLWGLGSEPPGFNPAQPRSSWATWDRGLTSLSFSIKVREWPTPGSRLCPRYSPRLQCLSPVGMALGSGPHSSLPLPNPVPTWDASGACILSSGDRWGNRVWHPHGTSTQRGRPGLYRPLGPAAPVPPSGPSAVPRIAPLGHLSAFTQV